MEQEFNAGIVQFANIGEHVGKTRGLGQNLRPKQVIGIGVVVFDVAIDAVFEEGKIDTDVVALGSFPTQIGIGQRTYRAANRGAAAVTKDVL